MPHGIAQCYLPPDRGDIPALTPAEAGTRSLSTARSADRVARIHLRQLTFANMTRSEASVTSVKSRLVLPFWYRLTRVYSPGQRAVKRARPRLCVLSDVFKCHFMFCCMIFILLQSALHTRFGFASNSTLPSQATCTKN